MQLHQFTFNPFMENTFVLYDRTGECVIVDPGCHMAREQQMLREFIAQKELTPTRLLNTHCHLDHVFGNAWVAEHWGLSLEIHEKELPILQAVPEYAGMYGISAAPSPEPSRYIVPGERIQFGETELEVHFAPGHSPGHVVFFHRQSQQLIGGDVLFLGSIGRTDLPGGNMETLMESIFQTILPLGDAVTVHPGHGPHTTLGHERRQNPFLLQYAG